MSDDTDGRNGLSGDSCSGVEVGLRLDRQSAVMVKAFGHDGILLQREITLLIMQVTPKVQRPQPT